jgi:tRNA(Ile2)-agmatinylcytidine synthase
MCTSFMALEVVRLIQSRGWDLVGFPRLVRLNPNIPWKTRGNGALCVRFGRGMGASFVLGRDGGETVWSYQRGRTGGDLGPLVDDLHALFLRRCRMECDETNPAFFLTEKRPKPGLYWKAVRSIMDPEAVRTEAEALGIVGSFKNGRGIVGAAAAVAWRPLDRTYEILAFRQEELWGTRREVDPESVRDMDALFPDTFNNVDPASGRLALTPRSPCPVLLGIRGEDPSSLQKALAAIRSEAPAAFLVFETNQGTDDHIQPMPLGRARPLDSLRWTATVAQAPRTIPGGHVVVGLRGGGRMEAVAYEPSGDFRRVVGALAVGDRITVFGSVRPSPVALNLEKLRVEELTSIVTKVSNPRCPKCAKSMKSLGAGAGFRCPRCRSRRPLEDAVYRPVQRSLRPGWYEPPVCSRRHLSKPIKRLYPLGPT